MMTEKDYSPLTSVCVKALNDKLYDKRKIAATEIEKMAKDFLARGDTEQIRRLLKVLGQDFSLSQNPHSRKGGLIGLAAIAIALSKESNAYIPELINPILPCFADADHGVRYYACESLFNIVKIVRDAVLPYFTEIFNDLSRLAADPEQTVKNASEVLDRLMKDIVTESGSFDLVQFMPTLREKMLSKSDFAQHFIISWVSVLNTVPDIDMVIYLPELLDGLFKILEDSKNEVKTMCATLLQEFLRSIKKDPSRVNFAAMNNIVILHSQSSDDLLQFTALTWIKEFVQLSGRDILPFTSGILTAVLPCLAYEADFKQNIKETAKTINFSLMRLVTSEDDENLDNVLLDLESVNQVLIKFLPHTKVPTKVAVLKWIYHLHTNVPKRMSEHVEKTFPLLLHVLSDCADEVVQQALEVIAEIVASQSPISLNDFINNLLRLFNADRRLLDERGSFIIRQLCVLLNSEEIYRAFSKALENENYVPFTSTMIDYLNTILLTSAELFELRTRLKDLRNDGSSELFVCLYSSWCHNPVATVALCLLSQNYQHACDLIRIFGSLEVTVEFLTEIDKLVQLIESPIFAYMRLELLAVPHDQYLVQSLYGLLMLLPQTEAFNTLRRRLDCIPSLHLCCDPKKQACNNQNNEVSSLNFPQLLSHFKKIQEQHRKERLSARTMNLLEKGVKNLD